MQLKLMVSSSLQPKNVFGTPKSDDDRFLFLHRLRPPTPPRRQSVSVKNFSTPPPGTAPRHFAQSFGANVNRTLVRRSVRGSQKWYRMGSEGSRTEPGLQNHLLDSENGPYIDGDLCRMLTVIGDMVIYVNEQSKQGNFTIQVCLSTFCPMFSTSCWNSFQNSCLGKLSEWNSVIDKLIVPSSIHTQTSSVCQRLSCFGLVDFRARNSGNRLGTHFRSVYKFYKFRLLFRCSVTQFRVWKLMRLPVDFDEWCFGMFLVMSWGNVEVEIVDLAVIWCSCEKLEMLCSCDIRLEIL